MPGFAGLAAAERAIPLGCLAEEAAASRNVLEAVQSKYSARNSLLGKCCTTFLLSSAAGTR